MTRQSHRQSRRGIVILIVLSLLVLFIVLAVTFAIVAGQYRRAADAQGKQELLGSDPRQPADQTLYAIVRDTNQMTSPLRGHSLLRDMYGASFRGSVSGSVTTGAGGQLVLFGATSATTLSSFDGHYNGCVLTFLDGPAKGLSTRVVGYIAAGPTLSVMAPASDAGSPVVPSIGNTFAINLHPFSGTGFGFSSYGSATIPQLSLEALKPNRVGETSASMNTLFLAGGANEDYDAADYQNMALAAVMSAGIIPSYHRPALIRYWMQQAPASWGQPTNPSTVPADWTSSTPSFHQFRQRLIFRPMPWDHPYVVNSWPGFSGSNPALDPAVHSAQDITNALLNGPWDVDNDGDGVTDSVWIDPGFPIQTAGDGRAYKTLVAVLCEDLDGRLNLNAHGSYSHLASLKPAGPAQPAGSNYAAPTPVQLASALSDTLPRGQGYGPPEINLLSLIGIANCAEYQALLQNRYGQANGDNFPGMPSVFDPLARWKFFEYPMNYFTSTTATAFFNPPDLRGEFSYGLDHRGQPLYERSAGADLRLDSPYEMNLVQPNASDKAFTLYELERILRYNDVDAATLPPRLSNLLTVLRNSAIARNAVTTHSFDLPVAAVHQYAPPTVGSRSVVEMLGNRLVAGGVLATNVNAQIKLMLAPELTQGLKFNVNRAFGNGQDDNANGVVDEHAAMVAPVSGVAPGIVNESFLAETVNGVSFDPDGNGVVTAADANGYKARYNFARQLYVLAMLLTDPGVDLDPTGSEATPALRTARVLAQWAINVVDFRDADSIMTPFEYDANPFNGWDVNGDLGTYVDASGAVQAGLEPTAERQVVWGCERPELLITETLAYHDRRSQDLSTSGLTTDPGPPPGETDGINDFDQALRPQGRLFVELYNPWTGQDRKPAEFYADGTNTWQTGVVLNKLNSFGSPVWRLVVTDAGAPLDIDGPVGIAPGVTIEREVYFASPAALPAPTAQRHYPSAPAAVGPLRPGHYGVIGGREAVLDATGTVLGWEPNTIGRRTDWTLGDPTNATRQIILDPSASPQVETGNNAAPPASAGAAMSVDQPYSTADIKTPVAIPIDQVIKLDGTSAYLALSVSEPLGGYPAAGWAPATAFPAPAGTGVYAPPIDRPFDQTPGITALPAALQTSNGTTATPFKRVYLQRLANPLLPYQVYDPSNTADQNARVNPYRTVDSMPIYLTVYNGVTATPDPSVAAGTPSLFSCERGANDTAPPAPDSRRLWNRTDSLTALPAAVPDSSGLHIFGQQLQHTLGYLNANYGTRWTSANTPAAPPAGPSQPTLTSEDYRGDPNTTLGPPFPWLAWNNRPFVSQLELLQVPRSKSSDLLGTFDLANTAVSPYSDLNGRYGHLLNFFASSATAPAPSLYRLFEFTDVPSRFVGSETVVNSTAISSFYPPFNLVSSFRAPGKINLNTLYSSDAWNALWNNVFPVAGGGYTAAPAFQMPTFDEFVETRRGYTAATQGAMLASDTSANPCPDFFANPFRAAGSGNLVPPTISSPNALVRFDPDCTLLRTLNVNPSTTPPAGPVGKLMNNFPDAARNTNRNSYFAYQALQRLPNLVTTRSNVYAVWVTVGYFEVGQNPSGVDATHPDGFRLGQEIGSDTGEVKRHRAFYIIDRSIPVAFESGENHNVDRCILLRRYIE